MFVIVKTLSVVPIGGIPRENERGLRPEFCSTWDIDNCGIPRENERGLRRTLTVILSDPSVEYPVKMSGVFL